MLFHEALNSTNTDRGRDKSLFHKMTVDLRGIQARERFFQPIDLFDGCVREDSSGAFVGAFLRHEGVNATILIEGDPLAEGFGAVLEYRAVRQGERFFCDSLIISVSGRVGIKVMDDRCDECEPELGHGRCA